MIWHFLTSPLSTPSGSISRDKVHNLINFPLPAPQTIALSTICMGRDRTP